MRLSRGIARGCALALALFVQGALGQVWWTQRDGIHPLDVTGTISPAEFAPSAGVVLVDAQAMWHVDADRLTRQTGRMQRIDLPAAWTATAGATLLASDGAGGVWIARGANLAHYDTALVPTAPVQLGAPVQALAAAGPDALFVALDGRVLQLDDRGAIRNTWDGGTDDGTPIAALHVDRLAGVLWVVKRREAVELDALDHLHERRRVALADARASALGWARGDLWIGSPAGVALVDAAGTRVLELAAPPGMLATVNGIAIDALADRVWLSDARGVVELALDPPAWTRVASDGPARIAPLAQSVEPQVDLSFDVPRNRLVAQVAARCLPQPCSDDRRYAAATRLHLAIDGLDATARIERDARGDATAALAPVEAASATRATLVAVDAYGNAASAQALDLQAMRLRASVKTNAPPSVTVTAPANNAIAVAPANFSITASASDPDGSVAKVEFYRSGTLLGTDATAPYAWSWTAVPVGTYTLTAKAYDNAGASTLSAPVTVQVKANTPPTITLSSPPANSTFVAPASILLSASASDVDGTVAKVDFLRGGTTLIGTVTSAPFSYTWSNVAAGTYSLTARATDDKGATTTSAAVTAKVNNPPSVTVTAPANNAVIVTPATITLQASATDSDGTVAKVEFFQNGILLGIDTSAPYTFAWANPSPGTYALTARATDNLGATRVSAAVNISVKANQAPLVALTAPATDVQRVAGTTLALAASASDTDGGVTKVEFRRNGTVIATDTTSPYTASMTVPFGSSVLTAVATDSKGAQTVSAPVTLTGVANQLPVIALDAPADGQIIASATPPDIALAASGHDADGAIVRVRFMRQTTFGDGSVDAPTVIATVTQLPYATIWHAVDPTTDRAYASPQMPVAYSVWAEADDDAGGTTVSAPATITVPNVTPWSVRITSPLDNSEFAVPATLVVVGTASRGGVGVGDVIAAVDLVADGAVVATLAAPNGVQGEYALVWRNAPAGVHGLSLRLTDAAGLVVQSPPVMIDVVARDQLPAVTLTAPATERVLVGGLATVTLPLGAAASDVDGAVARVEFVGDGQLIASSTAPYATSWASVPTGVHALHAQAFDDANRMARSAPVFVSVLPGERAPVVTMTSPTPGSSVRAGAPITLAADVIAPDGVVSRVDFVAGSTNTVIATAASAPYRATWSALAGTYAVRAIAYTVAHTTGISTPLTINVTSNSPPVVTLTSPLDGQAFAGGLPIALAATATDADGTVAKVDFLAGTTVIASSSAAPYGATWTPTASGTYALTARATDNVGATAVSKVATVTVLPAVASAVITSPSANAAALAGQPMAISVQAVIPGHPLARIEFLADGSVLGASPIGGGVTAALATFTWSAPPPGVHLLGARAVATDGTTVSASTVSITLSDLAVAIAEPFGGQTFLASGEIRIVAAPSGSAVSRVDFLGDGVVLASASAAPYVFVWRGMGLGGHRVTVRAVDAAGSSVAASALVQVVAAPTLGLDAGG